jgi:NAD(P)-dependent dehydrogenase (short-subunit alcohol dehydrogenase family)
VLEVRKQFAAEHADATLLVNAAGFFIPKAFSEYDEAFYDSYNELNRALFFITQTVVAGMVAEGQGGAIVNIGSMWAHQGIAATPHSGYSVQKGGLHSFTKALAIELAPHSIRVNAVAPAVVKTPCTCPSSRWTSSMKPLAASTASTRWGVSPARRTSRTRCRSCCRTSRAG